MATRKSSRETSRARRRRRTTRPIEVHCVAGGFPENTARINDVDLACLDDMSSRLRQDPRARSLIGGTPIGASTTRTTRAWSAPAWPPGT
jgi:hypothetical protein